MTTGDNIDAVVFFDPNALMLSASAASESGVGANYIVEYAISLEKMWEDGVFFDTPAEDAISIVANSTTVKMTVSLSDDDNFEQDGIERSNDLTYYRELDGTPGGWDQSNYYANLTFLDEFAGVVEIPGDCNGDGQVNALDLRCACASGNRDTIFAATGLLAGDLDGNGDVAFADFLTLSANFGQEVAGYADGDIDCDGSVGFPDFLALSANFGKSSGAAAAVPEPTPWLPFGLGGWFVFPRRRRHHVRQSCRQGHSAK